MSNASSPKVLVVFSYPLSPDRDAGSLRMYNLLSQFKALGWEAVFAEADLGTSESQREHLARIGVLELAAGGIAPAKALPQTGSPVSSAAHPDEDPRLVEAPPDGDRMAAIEAHLEAHGAGYDLVILSSLAAVLKSLSAVRQFAPGAKLVFDTTDLQHLREFRRARVTGEGGWMGIALRSKKWELAAVEAADATWVVSPSEQVVLEEACPGALVQMLSVIQEVHGIGPGFAERDGIVFIGSFPHHPNVDAMQHFVEDIYPILQERLPEVTVTVIGPEPPAWLQARAGDGLEVLGFVPDLRPVFDRCRMTIAPLRYGAGVNGKVLMSMSYGVPVVASPVAAEGLPVEDGREILVADEPEAFVEAVVRLHTDEALWARLSKNGLAVIEQDFSLAAGRTQLVKNLEELGF